MTISKSTASNIVELFGVDCLQVKTTGAEVDPSKPWRGSTPSYSFEVLQGAFVADSLEYVDGVTTSASRSENVLQFGGTLYTTSSLLISSYVLLDVGAVPSNTFTVSVDTLLDANYMNTMVIVDASEFVTLTIDPTFLVGSRLFLNVQGMGGVGVTDSASSFTNVVAQGGAVAVFVFTGTGIEFFPVYKILEVKPAYYKGEDIFYTARLER